MIDRDLYRQAYADYEAWNRAVEAERVRRAGELTPVQSWRRYVELVELCWHLAPEPPKWQRLEKLEALERYYERVRRMEAWRQEHGK